MEIYRDISEDSISAANDRNLREMLYKDCHRWGKIQVVHEPGQSQMQGQSPGGNVEPSRAEHNGSIQDPKIDESPGAKSQGQRTS